MTDSKITIETQIKCVERELATRLRTYPDLIKYGRMRAETAEKEIVEMEAVKATLEMEANQMQFKFE